VTVASKTEVAQIWNVASGSLEGQLEVRAGRIEQFRLGDDGEHAAIASRRGIQIWSMSQRKLLHQLNVEADAITELELDMRRGILGITSNDGSASLWSIATGIQVAKLQADTNVLWAIAFDPTSDRLVTGGASTTAILWSTRAASMTKIVPSDAVPNSTDLRGDRVLVTTSFATVMSLDGNVLARREIGPNGDAKFVDDRWIALLDSKGRLWLWDPAGSSEREIARHEGSADWIATDGKGAFASWAGREVIVADVARSSESLRWIAPARVTAIAFLADGRIAIADGTGTIHLFDRAAKVETRWQANGRVDRLHALPDGRLVSTGAHDVLVWSNGTASALSHSVAVIGSTVDRPGRTLAVSEEDGTIRLWDLNRLQPIGVLRHPSQAQGVFGFDDQLLATVDLAGAVRLWDLARNELLFHRTMLDAPSLIQLSDATIIVAGPSTTFTPVR
jgi:WD40 repeat protein